MNIFRRENSLVSLFKGISNFVGYLIPNPSLLKNSSGSICIFKKYFLVEKRHNAEKKKRLERKKKKKTEEQR